jgi:hypothetical protein
MAKQDYTPYQQKIIKRYYDNIDTIALQRVTEAIGDLYLSAGKKRQKLWEKIVADLAKLGLPASQIEHLRTQDNPTALAAVVSELQGKK